VEKSVFTPLYDLFRMQLIATAGLNQRELAKKLGRERSFVVRIELGERRLDVVEFFWVCQMWP
jgi:transcriptional regulator with XRE-family HTH domain